MRPFEVVEMVHADEVQEGVANVLVPARVRGQVQKVDVFLEALRDYVLQKLEVRVPRTRKLR